MTSDQFPAAHEAHLRELARPILIFQVIEGLRRGLSKFAGSSRIAVLLSSHENEPLSVFDPHNLLSPYKREVGAYFRDNPISGDHPPVPRMLDEAHNFPGPEIPGLIGWGRQSKELFYQVWFAECPPGLCSPGPVAQWLAKASWILSHELALGASVFTSSATHTLESYALYAVADHIHAQLRRSMKAEPGFRVEDVLKAVAGISTTYEEGKRASGAVVFMNNRTITQMTSLVRFPPASCPSIKEHKHVRKMLTMVEGTSRYLVSDGTAILGVGQGSMAEGSVLAVFRSGHGEVLFGSQLVCTFRDGELSGLGRTPQLDELGVALARRIADPTIRAKLEHAVLNLVQRAWDRSYGLTIVLDFGLSLRSIAGQVLLQPLPVIENLDLVEGMSRVDGALHIDAQGNLHGFACLLDGRAVPTEDRSRGARYNSALRFTADSPDAFAVVVSADGPVAILEGGRQINVPPVWSARDNVYMEPPRLDAWLSADAQGQNDRGPAFA